MKEMPDLIRRQEATNHTLRKYRKKDFDWNKRVNCIPMIMFHATKMGHRPLPLPPFRSPIGALKALKSLGHADCCELIDAVIPTAERIAPARMMMGDIAVVMGGLPHGEEDSEGARAFAAIGAAVLCLGPQKIIGWRADQGKRLVVIDIDFDQIETAWRL